MADRITLLTLVRLLRSSPKPLLVTPVEKEDFYGLEVVSIRSEGHTILYSLATQVILTNNSPEWRRKIQDVRNKNTA